MLLAAIGGGAWWWTNRVVPLEVEVAAVTSRAAGTQASVLNASGYVTARRRATVSSKVTGKVIEVNVEEGMAVREGQVLARLDDSTVRASLELARAQLEASRRAIPESEVRLDEAKITLGRRERLFKEQLATAADMDQAQAEVNSLTARIASLREQVIVAERQVALQQTALDDTVIRAPFSGVAISKDAQPGRDGVAGVGRRRLHAHRHQHHRRHALARDRGRRQRELHQPRDGRRSRSPPSSTPIRTGEIPGQGHHRWCRRPTGRRPRCWCASASTRSTRASCPTWA